MANPSRDWRQDRSRDRQHGQFHRDFDDNQRSYRSDFQRNDDTDYSRSVEGSGDYGGYGPGYRGAYTEEERAYRGDYSPQFYSPRPERDWRDGNQERYGRPGQSRLGPESRMHESRMGADPYAHPSSFAYGRNEYGSAGDWREPGGDRFTHWDDNRYPHQSGSSREGERAYRGSDGQRFGGGYDTMPSHRGKGPKGYQRSDERLKEVICERLSDDPQIDASEITLTVTGGIVKLTGTVDSRGDKFEVEEIASRCGGVRDIDNQLRVQSGLTTGRDLSLSSNAGYAATGLDSSSSGSRRPEAISTTSGLTSPAKKQ